ELAQSSLTIQRTPPSACASETAEIDAPMHDNCDVAESKSIASCSKQPKRNTVSLNNCCFRETYRGWIRCKRPCLLSSMAGSQRGRDEGNDAQHVGRHIAHEGGDYNTVARQQCAVSSAVGRDCGMKLRQQLTMELQSTSAAGRPLHAGQSNGESRAPTDESRGC
ncbi:unnamed protein product, partial [Dicrocoelium dendriticum]